MLGTYMLKWMTTYCFEITSSYQHLMRLYFKFKLYQCSLSEHIIYAIDITIKNVHLNS